MDFSKTLTHNYINTGKPFINSFLEEYSILLNELKSFFADNHEGSFQFYTVPLNILKMKEFVIKFGGFRAVELLADYEKDCAIGDRAGCKVLEKQILEELNIFKETWLGMLC